MSSRQITLTAGCPIRRTLIQGLGGGRADCENIAIPATNSHAPTVFADRPSPIQPAPRQGSDVRSISGLVQINPIKRTALIWQLFSRTMIGPRWPGGENRVNFILTWYHLPPENFQVGTKGSCTWLQRCRQLTHHCWRRAHLDRGRQLYPVSAPSIPSRCWLQEGELLRTSKPPKSALLCTLFRHV